MPLFGRSQKSPQELVKSLKESVTALNKETGEKKLDKVYIWEDKSSLLSTQLREKIELLINLIL